MQQKVDHISIQWFIPTSFIEDVYDFDCFDRDFEREAISELNVCVMLCNKILTMVFANECILQANRDNIFALIAKPYNYFM